MNANLNLKSFHLIFSNGFKRTPSSEGWGWRSTPSTVDSISLICALPQTNMEATTSGLIGKIQEVYTDMLLQGLGHTRPEINI